MVNMHVSDERKTILDRFFYHDRDLHAVGKACKIPWFDKFDEKFARDTYAYFSSEEKVEAIDKIAKSSIGDQEFVGALNSVRAKGASISLGIDRFRGRCYSFNPDEGFRNENRQLTIKEDVEHALEELGERGYYFLQAVTNLYKADKWDHAYGGVTWADILAEIRKLGGQYPSPRDIAILKSYKLYYKTGSRRYPPTIPEEIIEVVETALKEWKSEH